MKLYEYFPITPDNVVNVFKNVVFNDSIMKSTDYSLYKPLESDNLMLISNKFYKTVDDWWIIYFFNKKLDITFSILNTQVINDTIDYYLNILNNYDEADEMSKNKIFELVLQFYLQTYDLKESILKTTERLSTTLTRNDANFKNDFKLSLYEFIIEKEGLSDALKIPNLSLAFKMKDVMNNYSMTWNQL